MRVLTNFVFLFVKHFGQSLHDQEQPKLFSTPLSRDEPSDTNAAITRGDNDIAGELNYRTGKFDAGTDPLGWYDSDDT